jgi:hypothetical protein
MVFDDRSREPLCLANITDGTHTPHSSANPYAEEGKDVFSYSVIIALVGALPALLIYFAVLTAIAPTWTENNPEQVFKMFPLLLLPAAIYVAIRTDRWAVARAKRVYGEVIEALQSAGVAIKPVASERTSNGRAKLA